MTTFDRLLLALAGLCGLAGVAASAAAAHSAAGETLKTAAQFLLFHAPVLVGLVALAGTGKVHAGALRATGLAFLVGLALFSGDLALRALAQTPLFPMAAPAGGIVLMLAWAALVVAALLPART